MYINKGKSIKNPSRENPFGKTFIITSEDEALVKGNMSLTDFSIVSKYNHEESDTRVFFHVKCMLSNGHKNILFPSVNTDVAVIATSVFNQLLSLGIEQVQVQFGVGKTEAATGAVL